MTLPLEKICKVDQQLQKQLWNASVPLCVRVTCLKKKSLENVLILAAPRIWYLPMLAARVTEFLTEYGAWDKSSNRFLIFEWRDTEQDLSLPIHYPIGLLFDLCGSADNLPWTVSVSAVDETSEDPLKWGQLLYNSLLKEADYAQHSSSKRVLNLSLAEQEQLWSSLLERNYSEYAPLVGKICAIDTASLAITLASGTDLNSLLGVTLPKSIPCRWYFVKSKETGHFKYTQLPSLPVAASETPGDVFITVKGALQRVLNGSLPIESNVQIFSHGVEIPLETPFLWLYLNFSIPDCFLHIQVVI